MPDSSWHEDTPENRAKFLASIPLGRLKTPKRSPTPRCSCLARQQHDHGVALEVDAAAACELPPLPGQLVPRTPNASIAADELFGHGLYCEVAGDVAARPLSQSRAQALVEQPLQGLRERLRIIGRHQQRGYAVQGLSPEIHPT